MGGRRYDRTHAERETQREGGSKARVGEGGKGCVCTCARTVRRTQSYLLGFGRLACMCAGQILCVCVFVSVCMPAWARGGRGGAPRSVHAMSGRAGVSLLMVPYVTTLPPSFLRLMSVT